MDNLEKLALALSIASLYSEIFGYFMAVVIETCNCCLLSITETTCGLYLFDFVLLSRFQVYIYVDTEVVDVAEVLE